MFKPEGMPQDPVMEHTEAQDKSFLARKIEALKDRVASIGKGFERNMARGNMTFVVMAAIAVLAGSEGQAQEKDYDELADLADRSSELTLDEVHQALDKYHIQVPKSWSPIASSEVREEGEITADGFVGVDGASGIDRDEDINFSVDDFADGDRDLGVLTSGRLISREIDRAGDSPEDGLDTFFISETELSDYNEDDIEGVGKSMTAEGMGETRERAFIAAMDELSKQKEMYVRSVAAQNVEEASTTQGGNTTTELNQYYVDIIAIDSLNFFEDVKVASEEEVKIDGQKFIKIVVEARGAELTK